MWERLLADPFQTTYLSCVVPKSTTNGTASELVPKSTTNGTASELVGRYELKVSRYDSSSRAIRFLTRLGLTRRTSHLSILLFYLVRQH